MKPYAWPILLTLTFCNLACAQPQNTGKLSVNAGTSPGDGNLPQPITLFGCNNEMVNKVVGWDKRNQLLKEIPYGPRKSLSGKEYFLGKYYVASPPAYRGKNNKAYPFIGLVVPDRFRFHGDTPAQILNLDYEILEPTYLQDIPVDFTYSNGVVTSCAAQGVTSIPINTQCADFPWKNGAAGAAGIGYLQQPIKSTNNNPGQKGSTAFLPLLQKRSQPLHCTATLLDDVMLDHQVFFERHGELTKSVNLTDIYVKKETMNLVCLPRPVEDIPSGCRQ